MTTTTPHTPGTAASGQLALAVLAHRPQAALRLYCLPPAGLGPEFYLPWPPLLPPTVELCAVQLPGRGHLADQPSLTDPRQLAAALADLIHTQDDARPFALFGHSIGALLAFATTCRLRRTQRRLPVLLALSAMSAPHAGDFGYALGLRLAAGGGGLADLIGPIPETVLRDPRQLAAAYVPLLADVLLLLHYRHHHEAPLEVDLALYGGESDPVHSSDQLTAWNDLVTTPTVPRIFPGGHMYPINQAAALIDQLGKDLHAATRYITAP